MKELKAFRLNQRIPYATRIQIAAKTRDFQDVADSAKGKKYKDIKVDVEVYNDKYYDREPDTIGVTMVYPSFNKPTHMLCRFFPISIGERELDKQIKLLYKQFIGKIPQLRPARQIRRIQ